MFCCLAGYLWLFGCAFKTPRLWAASDKFAPKVDYWERSLDLWQECMATHEADLPPAETKVNGGASQLHQVWTHK